jgi:hypothetical protein
MFIKVVVVLVLLVIIASLAVALRHLLLKGERSPATVKALTFRIGLSVALFFMLLIGYKMGLLHPHGMRATSNAPQASGEVK